jgi:hypothetical protein
LLAPQWTSREQNNAGPIIRNSLLPEQEPRRAGNLQGNAGREFYILVFCQKIKLPEAWTAGIRLITKRCTLNAGLRKTGSEKLMFKKLMFKKLIDMHGRPSYPFAAKNMNSSYQLRSNRGCSLFPLGPGSSG